MKKLLLASGIVLAATTAMAEESTFTPYIQAERAIEAQSNTAMVGVSTKLPYDLTATAEWTMVDLASDARFEGSAFELDFARKFGDNVSVYLNNDFSNEFVHSESIVGVKVTF